MLAIFNLIVVPSGLVTTIEGAVNEFHCWLGTPVISSSKTDLPSNEVPAKAGSIS